MASTSIMYESQRLIWWPTFSNTEEHTAQSWGSTLLFPHHSHSSCLSDWSGWPRNQSASGQFKSWYSVHYCKPLMKSAQTDESIVQQENSQLKPTWATRHQWKFTELCLLYANFYIPDSLILLYEEILQRWRQQRPRYPYFWSLLLTH